MGIYSVPLYSCLVSDLSSRLNTRSIRSLSRANHPLKDSIWPGITGDEVACLCLLDSIFSKFEDEKEVDADQRALAKFLSCNAFCKRERAIELNDMTEIEAIALGEFKKSFYDFWTQPNGDYILNPQLIQENLAVGPGSSVGVKGESFYHKIAAGSFTGTRKSLYALVKGATGRSELWSETEKIRLDHMGGFKPVNGSRLSFVPKSAKISRTICTEPLLNMLVQKGIGFVMESSLKRKFKIDLADQAVVNRKLACIGSKDGSYGTIDLTSASDSISLSLLSEILPNYVFAWLMESRSPVVALPDGSEVQLHMVSSMGNAFTFPLQTILFSSVVIGVYNALGIKPIYTRRPRKVFNRYSDSSEYDLIPGNFSVFGDDIIVCRKAYDLVVKILSRIGFSVNVTKSFNQGPFRESCGQDFWSGTNVRGIYCTSLATLHDVYSLINRLNVWSSNHAIPLPLTIGYLMKGLQMKVSFLPVPPWDSDVSGIKVPYDLVRPLSLKRDRNTGSIRYKRYVVRAKTMSLRDTGSSRSLSPDGLINNPPGIVLSSILGYLRSGAIGFRSRTPHYQKRFAIAPCWDYRNPSESLLTAQGWQRWKSIFVAINLSEVNSLVLTEIVSTTTR